MAYSFSGFFVSPPVDLHTLVSTRWPGVIVRLFRDFPPAPFRPATTLPPTGILGVTLPTNDTVRTPLLKPRMDEDELYRSLLEHLPAISRECPHATIVAILALCHGGPVEASGAVFRNGACILDKSADGDGYDSLITECLRHLGVELTSGYFPPLEQGAFDALGTSHA